MFTLYVERYTSSIHIVDIRDTCIHMNADSKDRDTNTDNTNNDNHHTQTEARKIK